MLQKLQDSLQQGTVKFSFRKVDGSTREALGTLHSSMLPPVTEGASSSRAPQPHLQVYWDLEAKAFRSFVKDNLLSIGDVTLVNASTGIPETPANNPVDGLPSSATKA